MRALKGILGAAERSSPSFLLGVRGISSVVNVDFPEKAGQMFVADVDEALKKRARGEIKPVKKDVQISDADVRWAKQSMEHAVESEGGNELKSVIKDFRHGRFPILLISGLPVSKVSVPKKDGLLDSSKKLIKIISQDQLNMYFAFMAGLLGSVGREFAYPENASNRIDALSPSRGAQRGGFDGYNERLEWHVDDWTQFQEAYVTHNTALVCAQNNERAETIFLNAKDIFEKLPQKHREALQKPHFAVRHIIPNDYVPYPEDTEDFSIFSVSKSDAVKIRYGVLTSQYEAKLIVKNGGQEERDALSYLDGLLKELKPESITLKAGDFLIFNNFSPEGTNVIHGRKPFESDPNSHTRRLLIRSSADEEGTSLKARY